VDREAEAMTVEVNNIRYGTGNLDIRQGILTINQAAEQISVSPRTMRRLIAARRLRHLRIGSLVRIYGPDLDEFIENCTIEAAP
jgi:excisionase family DNA binding protein